MSEKLIYQDNRPFFDNLSCVDDQVKLLVTIPAKDYMHAKILLVSIENKFSTFSFQI